MPSVYCLVGRKPIDDISKCTLEARRIIADLDPSAAGAGVRKCQRSAHVFSSRSPEDKKSAVEQCGCRCPKDTQTRRWRLQEHDRHNVYVGSAWRGRRPHVPPELANGLQLDMVKVQSWLRRVEPNGKGIIASPRYSYAIDANILKYTALCWV